jgi:hypothetical protein
MSTENTYLVGLGIALLFIRYFLEPLALGIARFFRRLDSKRTKRARAGKPAPPGPACSPSPIEDAQMSKYR